MNTGTGATKGHKHAADDDQAAGVPRTRRSLLPLDPLLLLHPLRRPPRHLPAADRRERSRSGSSRASHRSPTARAPQAEQTRR